MHHGSWTLDRRQFVRCVLIALTVSGLAYACGICVNSGPSMDGLGWIYVTAWGAVPERTGQIVRFAPAGQPAWTRFLPRRTEVKRIVGFDREGGLIYEGDNSELSADCRDDLPPVPPENVAGVIVAAISPARILRSLTPRGRLRNRVEFEYGPKQRVPCGDGYLAWDSRGLREISLEGERPVDPWERRMEELVDAGGPRVFDLLARALSEENLLNFPLEAPPTCDADQPLSCELDAPDNCSLLTLVSVDRGAEFSLKPSREQNRLTLGGGCHLVRVRTECANPELTVRPLGSPDGHASAQVVAVIAQR